MDAVEGDGERLCAGHHLPAHVLGSLNQHVRGMGEGLSHAAVHMDPEHVKIVAAVGPSDGTGITLSAVKIGVDHHLVAFFEALWVVLGDAYDLPCQLVSDDPRVGDQTVGPPEGSDIAAADTRRLDGEKRFVLFGLSLLDVLDFDGPGFFHVDCFH